MFPLYQEPGQVGQGLFPLRQHCNIIQVLESLRAREWTGPAILVTGFPAKDLEQRALNAGFARVLHKPLVEGALADIVERLLK